MTNIPEHFILSKFRFKGIINALTVDMSYDFYSEDPLFSHELYFQYQTTGLFQVVKNQVIVLEYTLRDQSTGVITDHTEEIQIQETPVHYVQEY